MNRRMFVATAVYAILSMRASAQSDIPRFEDFPVPMRFEGKSASPKLVSRQQWEFRTRIRNGLAKGEGVWIGSGQKPTRIAGPNFAGRIVAVRWGCGSQCLMMALVDATSGTLYDPPLAEPGSLVVPLDNLSGMQIDFRPDSSLMILKDACRIFRAECGTYYLNWRNEKFEVVKFVPNYLGDTVTGPAERGQRLPQPERRAWPLPERHSRP